MELRRVSRADSVDYLALRFPTKRLTIATLVKAQCVKQIQQKIHRCGSTVVVIILAQFGRCSSLLLPWICRKFVGKASDEMESQKEDRAILTKPSCVCLMYACCGWVR